MGYAGLNTEQMRAKAMIHLHHLSARSAAMMDDPDAIVVEKMLEELLDRSLRLETLQQGKWTERQRARASSACDKGNDYPR